MNPHLSALQISECFVGGAAPFVEQHARECAQCRTALAEETNAWEPAAGGAICAACAVRLPHVAPLTVRALKSLRYLLVSDLDSASRLRLDSALTHELDRHLRRTGASTDAAAVLSTLMITFLEGTHVLCRAEGSLEPFDTGAAGVAAAARALLRPP